MAQESTYWHRVFRPASPCPLICLQAGTAHSAAFKYLGVTLQAQILLMVDLLLKHKLTIAQRGVLENVVITKVRRDLC